MEITKKNMFLKLETSCEICVWGTPGMFFGVTRFINKFQVKPLDSQPNHTPPNNIQHVNENMKGLDRI